jgi:acyl carrier protein
MDRELILERLANIFAEVVDLDPIDFRPELVLGEDLAATSSEVLRIVSKAQGKFAVKFRPMDIIRIRTVGDLADLIEAAPKD